MVKLIMSILGVVMMWGVALMVLAANTTSFLRDMNIL